MKKITVALASLLFSAITLPSFTVNAVAETATGTVFDQIMICSGRDGTELNVNWITYERPENAIVQIAKSVDMENGVFPEDKAQSFTGSYVKPGFGKQLSGKNYYIFDNEAVVKGLAPKTEYVYRVGDGYDWSDAYTYLTPATDSYKMFVFADIHMYDSYHTTAEACADWSGNLTQLMARHKEDNVSHILALGDQMQNSDRQDFIDALLTPTELRNLSFSPINGNHDVTPSHTKQKYFYNLPNLAKAGDEAYTGYGIEDYYYLYGNTLFVMLNYENVLKGKQINMGHWEKTFAKATSEYAGQYDWIVACTHDPVYGTGKTAIDTVDVELTNDEWATLEYAYARGKSFIDSCDKYGVDLVLTGHTHAYARSYFMKGGEIQNVAETERDGALEFIDPTGTVYVNSSTSNTFSHYSTGSPDDNELFGRGKFVSDIPWLANRYWDPSMGGYGRSTYSMLETDENYLKLTTWEVDRPEKLVDEFVITKTSIVPDEGQGGNQGGDIDEPPTSSDSSDGTDSDSSDSTGSSNNGDTDSGCNGTVGLLPLIGLLPVAFIALRKRKD